MNATRAIIAQSMAAREYKAQIDTRLVWFPESNYEGFKERAKIEQESSAFYSRMARQAMGLEDLE